MGLFDPPPRLHKPPHPYSALVKPPWFKRVYFINLMIWLTAFQLFWLLIALIHVLLWKDAPISPSIVVSFRIVFLLLGLLVAHIMSYRILFFLRDEGDDKKAASR